MGIFDADVRLVDLCECSFGGTLVPPLPSAPITGRRWHLMAGHGEKLGRKKEEAILALLTARNIEAAAKSIGVSAKTLLRWQKLPEFERAYRQARVATFRQSAARLERMILTSSPQDGGPGLPLQHLRCELAADQRKKSELASAVPQCSPRAAADPPALGTWSLQRRTAPAVVFAVGDSGLPGGGGETGFRFRT